MATLYNGICGYWSGYQFNCTLTGTVARSGDTITLSNLHFESYRAEQGWGTETHTISVCSPSNCTSAETTLTAGAGSVNLPNLTFTVEASATEAAMLLNCSGEDNRNFIVSFASGAIAPVVRTPTVVNMDMSQTKTQYVNISGSVSDFGTDSGPYSLVLGLSRNYGAAPQLYEEAYSSSSSPSTATYIATITPTSQSASGMKLLANTQYYPSAIATNGPSTTATGTPFYTKPLTPVITASLADNVIDVTMSRNTTIDNLVEVTAFMEYRISGGAWQNVTMGTLPASGATQTISSTITNLVAGATYQIRARMYYGVSKLYSDYSDIVTIVVPDNPYKLYASVSNAAREVSKIYASVGGVARPVLKVYRGDSSNKAEQVWASS